MPTVGIPAGRLDLDELLAAGENAFGALVVSGLICHEMCVGQQSALRLFGEGDLIAPCAPAGVLLAPRAEFAASVPSTLALLDDRFLRAARRWPRLIGPIVQRAGDAHAGVMSQLCISHHPRVEDRLLALFRALGERWGRVTQGGIVITLGLTHEALGRMVGARRPTITLALRGLAHSGRLARAADGSWLLSGDLDEAPLSDREVLTKGQVPRPLEAVGPA